MAVADALEGPKGASGPPQGFKFAPGYGWESGLGGMLIGAPALIPEVIPDANFENTPVPKSSSELAVDVVVYVQTRSGGTDPLDGLNCDAGSLMGSLCDAIGFVAEVEVAAENLGQRVENCRQSTCGVVASLAADIVLDVPKSLWELATGRDPVTGEELGYWRTLGIVPFLSIFRRTPADEFLASGSIQLDDAGRLFDELGDDVVFHYTDELGSAGIADIGRIVPGDSGYVYVTQDMLTSDEALNSLFIGNPAFEGRGDYVVAFRVEVGVQLTEGSQANELIHQGALRLSEDNLVYIGPNPWNS